MAYLAEEIDPRGLGATMGLYVGGTAFGGMSGRVLTGIFAEYLTWRPALFIIGAIGLAAAIGFIALLPPSRNFVRFGRASIRAFMQKPGSVISVIRRCLSSSPSPSWRWAPS